MFSSACSSKPHLAQPEYVIIGREVKTHSSEVSAQKMSCLYWPVETVNFSSKIRAFTWITPTKTISIKSAFSFIYNWNQKQGLQLTDTTIEEPERITIVQIVIKIKRSTYYNCANNFQLLFFYINSETLKITALTT